MDVRKKDEKNSFENKSYSKMDDCDISALQINEKELPDRTASVANLKSNSNENSSLKKRKSVEQHNSLRTKSPQYENSPNVRKID